MGNPIGRSARSARGLTRDAKAVSGEPEGTSRCGYQSLSLFVGSEVRGYDSPKSIESEVKVKSEKSESEVSEAFLVL